MNLSVGRVATVGERMAAVPGLDQTAVRRVNTAVVLRALAASPDEATLHTLAEATGLSRRTIELILGELIAEGWAIESAAGSGRSAGRPARRFRFLATRRLVAGVQIDTHFAHAIVADLRGRVLGRAERALGDDYFDPARAVARAAEAVRAAASEAGVPMDRLGAGGVAAGGVIDPERGIVRRLVNAPLWTDFSITRAFTREFGIPWVADNDANLAALAEFRNGAGVGRRHLAWLIHGHRTGAGFIVGGELHRGAGGAAGELIESRVLGLERNPQHPIGGLTSPLAEDRERAMAVVHAALAGDPEASIAATHLAAEIADIIDVIAWTIAPEQIVFGGGLEAGGSLLIPLVRARLRAIGAPDIELAASTIGTEATILGAVRNALDRIDAELYGPTVT